MQHTHAGICVGDETKVIDFFDEISWRLKEGYQYIIVAHIVKTILPFLNAIRHTGEVIAIIPKSSIHDETVLSNLRRDGYEVRDNLTKDELAKHAVVSRFLNEVTTPDSKVIIIDIGGYFARSIPFLTDYHQKIVGIIEDTENGYQKYDVSLRQYENIHHAYAGIPVISVARIQLKEAEDYNVGKCIVRAADTVLRTDAHTLIERKAIIGVIGFGKIGRSIAIHLRSLHIQRIMVCDSNPLIALQAASFGFYVTTITKLVKEATMIFSATGNNALNIDHYRMMQNGVVIASCTSRDDEFRDLNMLIPDGNTGSIYVFRVPDMEIKRLCFLSNGNAVNFEYHGVNGPYIYAVQASLLWAAGELAKAHENLLVESEQFIEHGKITPLCLQSQHRIARIWLRYFANRSFNTQDVQTVQ